MSEQDSSNWAAWIGALSTGAAAAGALMVAVLKSFFVTRGELREAIQDAAKLTDQRHLEHLERYDKQETELKEIRGAVSRIEGQISGRYPRLER